MVDPVRLEERARAAAERGRARMAVRVAVPVAGFVLGAVGTSGALAVPVALGLALVVVAAGLRFWRREGVDAVRLGLTAAAIPLLATAMLRTCGLDCAPWARISEAELACVFAGVAAGAHLAVRAADEGASLRGWALATGVASLGSALGCVALGAGGLAITLAALALGSTVTFVPLRARAA